MGYMDFNGVRYYDTREVSRLYIPIKALRDSCLESDSTKRLDSNTLAKGDNENA